MTLVPGEAIRATDYHTAGEPFRIVSDDVPPINGATVAEKRTSAQRSPHVNAMREFLCREPRGHANMYGCFIVDADDAGADFGALFWHNDGFSTACGHGTIALGTWAVQTGRVPANPDGVSHVTIDVPSGRVVAHVRQVDGLVRSVTFENVPSYVVRQSVGVHTSAGELEVDIAFGGALYASLDAAAAGTTVTSENAPQLRQLGREIKDALNQTSLSHHPVDPRLSGIYGVIFFERLDNTPEGPFQRNVTVFADGQIDRSPCGSGTAARLALLANAGEIRPDQALRHESIIGTQFIGRFRSAPDSAPANAIIADVEGMAYKTGDHVFTLADADPLSSGFLLA